AARCCWQTRTGAALNRLVVKTPATELPSASRMTSTSRRPGLRMAARAVPISTPATGNSASRAGIARFTGMGSLRHRRPARRSGQLAMALLVLPARTAGAGIVAADLLAEATHRLLGIVCLGSVLDRQRDRFRIGALAGRCRLVGVGTRAV